MFWNLFIVNVKKFFNKKVICFKLFEIGIIDIILGILVIMGFFLFFEMYVMDCGK